MKKYLKNIVLTVVISYILMIIYYFIFRNTKGIMMDILSYLPYIPLVMVLYYAIRICIIKKKAKDVILILSFVPYLYYIMISLYSSVLGMGFFFNVLYGIDAIIICGMMLGLIMIPVFIVCAIYQIIYLILYLRKKKKN